MPKSGLKGYKMGKIKGGFGHGSPKMFYSDQDVWIHKFTCKQFLVSKVKEGWTEQDSNIIWLSFRVYSILAPSSGVFIVALESKSQKNSNKNEYDCGIYNCQ